MFNNLNPVAFEEVINRVSDAVAILERPVSSRLMARFSPIMQHLEHNIVFANSAFCELVGKREDEITEKPLLAALPYSDRLIDVSDFLRPINSFESYKSVMSFRGIKGEFEVEIHPAGKSDPRVERKIIVLRQVAEDLPINSSPENGAEALAEIEAEAPDVLPRPRNNIRMSKRMISDLSHEIRTPLNAIIGFSELMQTMAQLETAQENGKANDYLNDIITSGRDLLLTLTSVMELARYDGTTEPDEEMECNLSESIRLVATESGNKFGTQTRIKVRGFRKVTPVKIDQMVLERILTWSLSFLCRLSERNGIITIASGKSKCGRAVVNLEIEQPIAYRDMDLPRAESDEFTCNDEENSFNLFLARRFLKIFGGYIEVVRDEEKNATGIKLFLPLAPSNKVAKVETSQMVQELV